MATIGVDCQVVLDGTGYWIERHSYRLHRPRLRRASVTVGGGERYVDAGPGKRVWAFTVLAVNELVRYDGRPTGVSGQGYRDSLVASTRAAARSPSWTRTASPGACTSTTWWSGCRTRARN